MVRIISISEVVPNNSLHQQEVMTFAKDMFKDSFPDIDRLLKVFQNGEIETRYFTKELEWYRHPHSFAEKNQAFIENAIPLGVQAIKKCLQNYTFLSEEIDYKDIHAIFFITSTGIATPSIEARIMNVLPFSEHTKRIPIWGLGCAGGAVGLSRAFEYCQAYPNENVLVLSIELCSLTFQNEDSSKSNLIGTSLFADGVACALIAGNKSPLINKSKRKTLPEIISTQSTLMKNSLDVMGWEVKEKGLYVIFSKDIPSIIQNWLKPNVDEFLKKRQIEMAQISHFIAHPGGKKVIRSYEKALNLSIDQTEISRKVLHSFGNMSSATILFVLKRYMEKEITSGSFGLVTALGPGFSSELLLVRWI